MVQTVLAAVAVVLTALMLVLTAMTSAGAAWASLDQENPSESLGPRDQ
jgi:hypothetical protein